MLCEFCNDEGNPEGRRAELDLGPIVWKSTPDASVDTAYPAAVRLKSTGAAATAVVAWRPSWIPDVIKPTKPCVVYIVDDDDLVGKGLARLMRSGGLSPKVYQSPELFLEEVSSEGPACILLDITMPGMNGFQVQAQLKARGITTPVITVSARDDEETRRRAYKLDARFFFRKPVDDQALLDAITWVVQTHGDTRSTAAGCGGTSGRTRSTRRIAAHTLQGRLKPCLPDTRHDKSSRPWQAPRKSA